MLACFNFYGAENDTLKNGVLDIMLPTLCYLVPLKVYLSPPKFDMWNGHSLEVHCTNIQRKKVHQVIT